MPFEPKEWKDEEGPAGLVDAAALIDLEERVTSEEALPSSVVRGIAAPSSDPLSVAGIPIIGLDGLRRWRAALADAVFAEAPIICVGDSHTFGQNANGLTEISAAMSEEDGKYGYTGQLRKLFAATYGDPGEGFIFSNPAADARSVSGGAGNGTFTSPTQAAALLHHNFRMTKPEGTITLTIPSGCTRLGVIQSNHANDKPLRWKRNGEEKGEVSAVTGTDVPFVTYLNVAEGDTVIIMGPAAGNNTTLGFTFRTAQTTGVPVHRVGQGGYTQGMMLGGDYNGKLATLDGVTFFSEAEIIRNIRALYQWAPTKGLIVIMFGTNEQTNQQGAAGINNGITPALFKSGLETAVKQIAADGWCSLLVGPCPSGSEKTGAGVEPLSTYTAQMKAVAEATDHVAFMDIADLWGGYTKAAKEAAASAGLRDAGSSHPTRKGYGDQARNLYKVLTATTAIGN